jgi:hypothetical protein
MPEISRLSGSNDWTDLDFAERKRTPELAMKRGDAFSRTITFE